jgi:pyruvate kinase
MPYISDKDREDIIFGIQHQYDFIAASFVRTADDVNEIRKMLNKHKSKTKIVAKIENYQGVENIDEIIKASDAIMIARGDMGVEIPYEEVPVIQKMIIKKVYNSNKQVITATQMLDSMMKNPRPTRAETTDVANAIYDGTSAIMLSGETAAGNYPVESLKTMVKIAARAEADIDYKKRFRMLDNCQAPDITDAISRATVTTAHDLNAKMIITVTTSGKTARIISRYRPECQILGCTTDPIVYRQLNLSWGVTPLLMNVEHDTFELFDHAVQAVEDAGYLEDGEIAVLTAGVPLGMAGTTNLIKVQVAGSEY